MRITFYSLVVCLAACSAALGAEWPAARAHLPIVFRSEGAPTRTAALLEVTELQVPKGKWWEDDRDTEAFLSEFGRLIRAFKSGDKTTVRSLSGVEKESDSKKIDDQAAAFIAQFKVVELVSVDRCHEFDDLIVLSAQFRFRDRLRGVPFVFRREKNNGLKFLPNRSASFSYVLFDEWFSTLGPGSGQPNAPGATEEEVARITHRMPTLLGRVTNLSETRPSFVCLSGAPVAGQKRNARLAGRVDTAAKKVERLRAGARSDGRTNITQHMSERGAKGLNQWLDTATAEERQRYLSALEEQQPFFIFDAAPISVVYVKAPSAPGGIAVLYFQAGPDNELLWVNSAYLSPVDGIFKSGPLFDSAASDRPFSIFATP